VTDTPRCPPPRTLPLSSSPQKTTSTTTTTLCSPGPTLQELVDAGLLDVQELPSDEAWFGEPDPSVYAPGTNDLTKEQLAQEVAKGNVATLRQLREHLEGASPEELQVRQCACAWLLVCMCGWVGGWVGGCGGGEGERGRGMHQRKPPPLHTHTGMAWTSCTTLPAARTLPQHTHTPACAWCPPRFRPPQHSCG
jgi:hypothetical protein